MAGARDGVGSQALFDRLGGIALDDAGNCYVTDGSVIDNLNKIRRITPGGVVTSIYWESGISPGFSSIAVSASNEIYFVPGRTEGLFDGYLRTWLSRLSPTSVRTDLLTNFLTGIGGTAMQSLSSGHTTNLYYLQRSYYGGDYGFGIHALSVSGSDTLLYETRGFGFLDLLADRYGNVYFGGSRSIWKVRAYGEPATVYRSVDTMAGAFAADVEGNLYAFENNRLIKLLINYQGLGLTAFTDGGGTVTVDPPYAVFRTNDVVNVTAAPWSGWTFLGWTNDASGTETNLTFTMTNHLSLNAMFAVALNTPVTNGSVLRDPDQGLYPYGADVQLTAQPNVGFEFVRWSDGSTNRVRSVEETNVISLSPEFSALPAYTVSVAALGGVGGTVIRNPDQPQYFRDTPVVLTARPSPGYVFQVWLDNILDNPRTVVVSSNTTLFASFAQGQGTTPQIISGPRDTNVFIGGQAVFSVTAQGSSPLEYQWQLNGTNLMGATSPLLTIWNVQPTNAGLYSVMVTNSVGSASARAQLNVYTPFSLETALVQSDGRIHFSIVGESGTRYAIDRSLDLLNWQEVTVLDNPSGTIEFTDPFDIGVPARFYRARLVESP